MLVLSVLSHPDKPTEVMALTIPMSTSPVSAKNPHAEKVRPSTVKGLADKNGSDSWYCTDSPNMVRINGTENGLRRNIRAQGTDQHIFCHGHVTDMRTVERLLAKTGTIIKDTGYRPPVQGDAQDKARLHLVARGDDARRINTIHAAARMESAAQTKALPSVADTLAAAEVAKTKRPTLGLKSAANSR